MIRLFLVSLRRHLQQARVLNALTAGGVALGVAAVVGIQILNQSSVAAFRGSIAAVRGAADLTVVGPGATFEEERLVEVRGTRGVADCWPLLRLTAATGEGEGVRFLELLGMDVANLASLPFREPFQTAAALGRPGWVALTPEAARELGREPGDTLEVTCGSRSALLTLGNLVELDELGPSASRLRGVMDLAELQDQLGQTGRIHQIQVRCAEGEDPDVVAERLQARLGPSFSVLTPSEQVAQAEELLGAFRLNLTALSAVSLFVGFFVVYTTVQATLVRRRREFGVLRCVGATRGQVLALTLAEVLLLGLCGTVLGFALGWAGARGSLADVSATLTNLYLLEEVRAVRLSPWLVPLALATGVGGALAGAIGPVRECLGQHPRQLLSLATVHERTGRASRGAFGWGLAIPALTFAWYLLFGHAWRPSGFVLGLSVLVGLPLVTPFVLSRLLRLVGPGGFGVRYGLRSLAGRLHGSAFCTASLAVSISILLGLTMMVASFRGTLERWLNAVLAADVYVTTTSTARAGEDATLEPDVIERVTTREGVREYDLLRRTTRRVGGRPVPVVGVRMDLPGGGHRFPLLEGDAERVLPAMVGRPEVLISQPLARRIGLGRGATLELPSEGGAQVVRVAGVYEDYGSESGALAMDLGTFESLFGAGRPQNVSLYLADGQDAERVVAELQQELLASPLLLRSNARLRTEALRIFDQTFLVTRTLQLVTLLVAALGIATTLLVLAEEQRPEIALGRCLGAERSQVFRVFLGKGLGIGAVGALLGAVGGVLLALVLVKVINAAWFGWTIQTDWRSVVMPRELGAIAAVVLAACLYPAWKATRTPAGELTRDDA